MELNESIAKEYERWRKIVGADDPYLRSNTLGIHDVLKAHFLIADFFFELGEGLGGLGPMNLDILHSALGRQLVGFGGRDKWETDFEICATLLYGLIMDHPFHDANKRTAFLSCLYLLRKIKRAPTIPHKEFEDFTVEIASHGIENRRRYIDLKKSGELDPEVKYIAKVLKDTTRNITHGERAVTYRELRRILNRFGFDLDNPHHNAIDVLRVEKKKKIFSRRIVEMKTKIGTVGFPSWTKQVAKGDIKRVREITKLDGQNHVDSEAFYYGVDDMRSLIAMYQDPLIRLANR